MLTALLALTALLPALPGPVLAALLLLARPLLSAAALLLVALRISLALLLVALTLLIRHGISSGILGFAMPAQRSDNAGRPSFVPVSSARIIINRLKNKEK